MATHRNTSRGAELLFLASYKAIILVHCKSFVHLVKKNLSTEAIVGHVSFFLSYPFFPPKDCFFFVFIKKVFLFKAPKMNLLINKHSMKKQYFLL